MIVSIFICHLAFINVACSQMTLIITDKRHGPCLLRCVGLLGTGITTTSSIDIETIHKLNICIDLDS